MHPLILYDANKPGDLEKCEAFGAEVLRLCVEVGGCLTGEHGVGIEKRDLMGVQYRPRRSGRADGGQGRVRPRLAAERRQGVSAGLQPSAAGGLNGRAPDPVLRGRAGRNRRRGDRPLAHRGRRYPPHRRGARAKRAVAVRADGHHALRAGRADAGCPRRHAAGRDRGDAGRAAPAAGLRADGPPGLAGQRGHADHRRGLCGQHRRAAPGAGRRRAGFHAGGAVRRWRGQGDQERRPGDEERHRLRSGQAAGRQPRHAGRADRGGAEGAARGRDQRDADAGRAGRCRCRGRHGLGAGLALRDYRRRP